MTVKNYKEFKGYGTSGTIQNRFIKIGSAEFVLGNSAPVKHLGTRVYVSLDDEFVGCFTVKQTYRKGLKSIISSLKSEFDLKILSGDNSSEQPYLKTFFGEHTEMAFEQKPENKLQFIHQLQQLNKKVLMIGDGLNDAGALKQSDVGIAISDDTNNFSPACDAVLAGSSFYLLNDLITFCRKQKTVIYASFVLSILYNFVGLYFAVQGTLQPVIAAILMPVSSISIVLLTSISTWVYALKLKENK